MFCNKCGNEVNSNQKFCNKCGNMLAYNIQNENMYTNQYNPPNYDINRNINNNKRNIVLPVTLVSVLMILILGTVFYILSNNNQNNYYFDNEIPTNEVSQTSTPQTSSSTRKKSKYKTDIITDNVYSKITVSSIEDANKLIREDSLNQKQSDYSKEIIEVEDNIIKHSITAVNLKEMDVEFAKELENVVENIYTNYPGVRGHLTNLTLINLDMSEAGVLALFRPIFMFGTSDTTTTRPWVLKTQIQLNARYFLNPERIVSTVEASSKSGHFPPNATKYSPVAHEFGHYLSFIALLNYYSIDSILIIDDNQMQNYYNIIKDFGDGDFSKQMLEEAHQNYIRDNGNIDFDEWRGQISDYALAKDESGNYIYDESIAEAFHDVYLNNENANIASKYIVEVLKKYIES